MKVTERRDSAVEFNTLTKDQKVAFDEMKTIMVQNGTFLPGRHTTKMLCRFLIARQWHASKAAKMLEEAEVFRNTKDINKIVREFTYPEASEIHELFPQYLHKTDKFGRPIFILHFDKADGNKIFKATTQDRLITNHIRTLERFECHCLKAAEMAKPQSNGQLVIIADLKGAYLSQFTQFAKLVIDYFSIPMNYYPELLGSMRIVNAPYLFTAVWSVIKRFLDEQTLAKIEILGTDYETNLAQFIPKESLPTRLGGSCQCEGGCENNTIGVWNDGSLEEFVTDPIWESFKARDSQL